MRQVPVTNVRDFARFKQEHRKISIVTAYDAWSAHLVERSNVDAILVGDSAAMVMHGHRTTVPATVAMMALHTAAVARAAGNKFVIADMPFLSYRNGVSSAMRAVGALLRSGAHAVKLEGGAPVLPIMRRLVELGIPVMGHLGFTPQSEHQLGRRVQGRRADDARRLIEDALAAEAAGAFALVLELVPAELAREISTRLHIPTIGIGAGPGCDGQVQIWHDLLGAYTDFVPRHARRYANLADTIASALQSYAADVRAGAFPTSEHGSTMKEQDLQEAIQQIEDRQATSED